MPADPTDLELDDDIIDLPPLPAIGDCEEVGTGEVGEESELLDLDGCEEVGTDDAEGLDDLDVASLLDLEDEDGGSFLDDELSGDAIVRLDEQLQLAPGGEYGWAGDAEAAPELFEDVEGLVDLPAVAHADDGEALGEDGDVLSFAGDDELEGLPPLEESVGDGNEEIAEDLDLADDGDLWLFGQDSVAAGSTELPPPVREVAEVLAQGAVEDLALSGDVLWLVGDDLRRIVGTSIETLPAQGLEPEELVSVTVEPHRGGALVVGTRLGGVFRSLDGGETFAAVNGWRSGREPTAASRVAFDGAGRLWLWAGGALHRSDDRGSSWKGPVLARPVIDAAADDEGRLVVLASAGGGLEVLRCRRDGSSFELVAPPCRRSEASGRLAVGHGRVAVLAKGDVQGPWVFDGAVWRPVPALAGAHLGVFIDGVLHGAVHHRTHDRGALIREGATVADLTMLFGETPEQLRVIGADQRIRAIGVGRTRVFVASGRGLVSCRR